MKNNNSNMNNQKTNKMDDCVKDCEMTKDNDDNKNSKSNKAGKSKRTSKEDFSDRNIINTDY